MDRPRLLGQLLVQTGLVSEARVPEYWIINATDTTYGIPPRSCLALSLDPSVGTWTELPTEGERFAPDEYRGRPVLVGGRIQSLVLPGFTIDIEEFLRDAADAFAEEATTSDV